MVTGTAGRSKAQVTAWTWGGWHLESGEAVPYPATEPLPCGIGRYLWVDAIELSGIGQLVGVPENFCLAWEKHGREDWVRPAREQTKRGFSGSFPSLLWYLFNGIQPWPSCVRGCDEHLVFLGFRWCGSRGFAPRGSAAAEVGSVSPIHLSTFFFSLFSQSCSISTALPAVPPQSGALRRKPDGESEQPPLPFPHLAILAGERWHLIGVLVRISLITMD